MVEYSFNFFFSLKVPPIKEKDGCSRGKNTGGPKDPNCKKGTLDILHRLLSQMSAFSLIL